MYLRFFTLVDKAYNNFSSYSSRYNKKGRTLSIFEGSAFSIML